VISVELAEVNTGLSSLASTTMMVNSALDDFENEEVSVTLKIIIPYICCITLSTDRHRKSVLKKINDIIGYGTKFSLKILCLYQTQKMNN
jgi:hypothetical protein